MSEDHENSLIVILSPKKTGVIDAKLNLFECYQFEGFHDSLLTKTSKQIVYVVESEDPEYTHEMLWQLRGNLEHYADICFVQGAIKPEDENLSDGDLPDQVALSNILAEAQQLKGMFKNVQDSLQTHEQWLMQFLLMRPGHIIKPWHDWSHARRYRYSLLEAFAGTTLDTAAWLNRLVSQGILQRIELIDRQRECAFCKSAQLSFIDVCPNCSSIDIDKQTSLHCFSCGNVAPQDDFMSNGVLLCPNCSTRLRHIGADYDRPLENFRCNSCAHFFIEGEVVCRCAICQKSMPPSDLLLNSIHSWKLSDHGRMAAIHGQANDLFEVFDHLNYVPYELFTHDLNWLLIQAERYKATNFSVLGLYFPNIPELISEVGHHNVFQLLEGFSGHIRSLVRRTDLCARTVENTIWILLPHTDAEGVQGLKSRIAEAVQLTKQPEDQLLICNMSHYSSCESPSLEEDALLLLARMQSELR